MNANQQQPYQPAPKRGCIIPCLLVGIFCILCLGGCGALMYFTIHEVNENAEVELGKNTVIKEHIGMIKNLNPNYAEFDKAYDFSYMIEGTQGFGKVEINACETSEHFNITSGKLTMPSGQTFDLKKNAD